MPRQRRAKRSPVHKPKPAPRNPTEAASLPTPYQRLARLLHELFLLAWRVRTDKSADPNKMDPLVMDRLNSLTVPWDEFEREARGTSASRGIPFAAFDRALRQARKMLHELVQVAAGNETVPFHPFDRRYTAIERRLVELGESWEGAMPDPGKPGRELVRGPRPVGAGQPTLSPTEQAVLEIIRAQPNGKGIIGKDIIKELRDRGMELSDKTLRRHILPKLRDHFGVVNVR